MNVRTDAAFYPPYGDADAFSKFLADCPKGTVTEKMNAQITEAFFCDPKNLLCLPLPDYAPASLGPYGKAHIGPRFAEFLQKYQKFPFNTEMFSVPAARLNNPEAFVAASSLPFDAEDEAWEWLDRTLCCSGALSGPPTRESFFLLMDFQRFCTFFVREPQ